MTKGEIKQEETHLHAYEPVWHDVFVGLNGKTYLIKRGVEVEVPEGVAKILARKEKMLSIAMEYEAQAAAPLDELAKMYQ